MLHLKSKSQTKIRTQTEPKPILHRATPSEINATWQSVKTSQDSQPQESINLQMKSWQPKFNMNQETRKNPKPKPTLHQQIHSAINASQRLKTFLKFQPWQTKPETIPSNSQLATMANQNPTQTNLDAQQNQPQAQLVTNQTQNLLRLQTPQKCSTNIQMHSSSGTSRPTASFQLPTNH
jgi:hypothetical protein